MPVLSRIQENDIFKLATERKLNPSDFSVTTAKQPQRGETRVFRHQPTNSYFDVSLAHDGKLWLTWWPGFSFGERSKFVDGWQDATVYAVQWISVVKENDDAPDLWAEAFKARELTDAAGRVAAANTPFDPGEVELIKGHLAEIEAFIESKQRLADPQRQQLHARFNYLLGAAKRGLGRIDWLNIAVSQLLQLFTDGVLHSSLYGEVMRHAATLLRGVIDLGGKLLGS